MKTTDQKIKYVPQHVNGHFIDIFAQPVSDFMKAARFNFEEDLEKFLLGRYGPDDPQNFRSVPVLINYELEVSKNEHISKTD